MNKIKCLTGIRAYSALWVVLFHMPHNQIIGQYSWGRFIERGYLGVDVFFVLSGFILTHVYAESFLCEGVGLNVYKAFILKRFARIYPVHLFSFCVFLVLWLIAENLNYNLTDPEGYSATDALYNLLMVNGWGFSDHMSWNRVSWSISAEWFAYLLLFPLAMFLLLQGKVKLLGGIVLMLWIVGFGYAYHYRGDIALTHNAIPRIAFEFLAGVLCNRQAYRPMIRRLGAALFWLGFLGLLSITQTKTLFEFFSLPAIACIIVGLNNGSAVTDYIFGNTVVVYLGEISYSLYMTHPLVNVGFNQWVRFAAIQQVSQMQATVIMALLTMLSIAFAALCHRLIETKGRVWVLKCLAPVS